MTIDDIDQIEVWIGVIRHNHGTDTYAARTEAKLEEIIYAFVEQWWGEIEWDYSEDETTDLPEDHEKAIEIYFKKMEDFESLEINKVII